MIDNMVGPLGTIGTRPCMHAIGYRTSGRQYVRVLALVQGTISSFLRRSDWAGMFGFTVPVLG